MPLKIIKPLIMLCAAVAIAALVGGPANATALITSHTGTTGMSTNPSDPAGTGEADVQLNCTFNFPSEDCTKTFFSNDRHEIAWTGSGSLVETIINSSGVPWTDYHFEWTGFTTVVPQIGNFDCEAGEFDGELGDCAVSMSMGTASNGGLWIFFNSPFTPGSGSDFFNISFQTEGSGTFVQYPTIPEPGTLALFGLGLAGLSFARRKRMS